MRKSPKSLISVLFISAILFWVYYTMMPRWIALEELPQTEFSTKRALSHVAQISKSPHYTGSENHHKVVDYLVLELRKLGLEPEIQSGTTLSDWGNLVSSQNIIARIKGSSNTGKALLLLSHYDSAPHSSSYGAADDASGVATILEGIRAFRYSRHPQKNDIIILFSDAEELGLNGAALFVTQHKYAKEVGLALNFEARGTSGPSYMLMETVNGNSQMVDAFSSANADYPVSNSLMYSIYKMLPNDTDLTVFREQGNIPGFNFAFIDSHFNYHTAQDKLSHLSLESLSHQGSYLMPLLKHFSNANLSLNSSDEQVYFSTPFGFIHYPFSWNFVFLAIAFALFLFLMFIGLGKRLLSGREIGKGFLLFTGALLLSGAVGFFGWTFLTGIYPQYNDILQGFTYNGHSYIFAFAILAFAITLLFYVHANSDVSIHNLMVAPLLFWILINLGIAVFLPGAGFFVFPLICSLIAFGYFIVTQQSSSLVNLILSIPALIILAPLITMFPVGLGLKILFGSMILVVLIFGLLLPIFAQFRGKAFWAAGLFLVSIGFFVHAHLNSDYAGGKAKPNSLLYVYDADKDRANWATYDKNLDEFTKIYLSDNVKTGASLSEFPLFSKYGSRFTFTSEALVREIPEPTITFEMDSVIGSQRYIKLSVTPNRRVNRYDVFAPEALIIHNLKANGAKPIGQKGSRLARRDKKILSYYVVDNQKLELEFSIPKASKLDMQLLESSFDLMSNPTFRMAARKDWMMPTPFVLNDAIVLIKSVRPTPKMAVPMQLRKNFALPEMSGDTIADPDAVN